MRHFCLSGTVTALACGMGVTTTQTRLIALPGSFKGKGSSLLRTVTSAVALTMVTGAANQYSSATAGAEIVSAWRFHRQ